MEKSFKTWLIILFLILNACDISLTYIGICYGARELNPLFKWLFDLGVNGWIVSIGIKLMLPIVLLYRAKAYMPIFGLVSINLIYLLVITNNLICIMRLKSALGV